MMMKRRLTTMAAALVVALGVQAAPPEAEIAKLGKSLTALGAIKAGNEDGTIPEWTGGLCKPPANYKPIAGAKGGSPYADPFPDDKPLFTITAANLDKYADKLDPGTKELFKRYPDSYKMPVYQTRRTACLPDFVYENTIKNVRNPRLIGKAPGVAGAHAQIPFPIPSNGYEAMWNASLRYDIPYSEGTQSTYLIDANGGVTFVNGQKIENRNLYWDNELKQVPDGQPYWALIATQFAPASAAGVAQMRYQFLDQDAQNSMAWSYVPGQRRVRLAPEFTYDTVSTSSGGILLFDEIQGFDGKMDKFDFKLIGRKEYYVPYNAYKAWAADPKVWNTPKHSNPDVMRWELHRVWVVEGTLKPGQRHVQKLKRFYIDEDSWSYLMYNSENQAGKLHHVAYFPPVEMYDKPAFRASMYSLYDLSKGNYSNGSMMGAPKMTGFYKVAPYPATKFTPGSMAGTGVR